MPYSDWDKGVPDVPNKSPAKGPGPRNSVAPQSGFRETTGLGVKVSAGKGGVNIGTLRYCSSSRGHKNVSIHY